MMVSMSCPSAGASPSQWKWAFRSPGGGGPVGPQAMNRGLASSNAARLTAESVPASATTGELGDAVGGLEGLHHGDDRGGLSPVALPAAGLEGGDHDGRPAGPR